MGLTGMALRTVVILCLVLLCITLTLSNKHKNSKVRKHHHRSNKGSDYEMKSTRSESKHGVGSKHGKKGNKGEKKEHHKEKGKKNTAEEMTILGMMIWICSLVGLLMTTWICSLVWRPNKEKPCKNVNLLLLNYTRNLPPKK